jgi:bacterial polymer biosynthesis proteins, WecB/TagA/CpsF family
MQNSVSSKRLPVVDLWVDPVNMEEALNRVSQFVEFGDRPHCIFAVNPEKNFSVPANPLLYETFKNADLFIPDGIGVVMAARILHHATLSRVPGVELMERICGLAAEKKYKIFLYGAKEEISRKAAEVLVERYPGIQIAGRANGYVKDEEMPDLIQKINDSKAEILFLALGSPKQEKWYSDYKNMLKTVRVCQGIGGTLDAITGNVKRAPEFWCNVGLEWLYRLLSEPKRIRRQKVLPIFAWRVFAARMNLARH